MLLIIALIPATLLMTIWVVLLCMVTKEDWIAATYNNILDNIIAIDKLRQKDAAKQDKLAEYHGIAAVVMQIILGGNSEKEIAKMERKNERMRGGDLNGVGIIDMPGYVLQRKFEAIGRGGFHKKLVAKNLVLYGKKHAENRTKQLLAKILSYPIIGVAVSIAAGALFMGAGNNFLGLVLISLGPVIVLALVYSMYDSINSETTKRRETIERQFPNVVSKLALLVTSGMIMDKAWKETAYSQNLELYREMQKTSQELDSLVSPEVAYSDFLNRCSTKETAKLASAILQNLSKGNKEIGVLLKDLATDAWQERRHTAKRDSERANAKLLIPTMLLFLAIIIMIVVPVAMNFGGL